MLPFVALSCLSFHAPLVARVQTATAPARTAGFSAPMSTLQLRDLRSTADILRANAAAGPDARDFSDALIRGSVYACRVAVGAGAYVGATAAIAAAALPILYSLRTLTTLCVWGGVRAARGFGETACQLERVTYGSMLCYYPIEMWRWWSNLMPGVAGALHVPVAPLATTRRVTAAIWLLWIGATSLNATRQLRATHNVLEKRQLRRRLRKLALDTPLAANWLLPRPPLPLLAIGLLGALTSALQLNIVLVAARCPHWKDDGSPPRRRWLPSLRLPSLRLPSLDSLLRPLQDAASALGLGQRALVLA